jgi:multidrug efflux pump subunit AcrA (membrane-fusion protein)
MTRKASRAALVLALGGVLAASACGRKEEPPPPAPPLTTMAPATLAPAAVRVTVVDLGRAVGPDKNVTDRTDTFKPTDTIYATVGTDGSSPGTTLKAKWSFQDGQTVNESSQTIAPTGPAVTEFHISKPSGWPKGAYKVEIFMDGVPVGTKDFKVG